MSDDRLGVYILDVGQGDCTFIVPPKGQGAPILFDCNDAYVAERFTSNHNINRLHAVVASHLDRDHIRGIVPFLLNHFAAGRTLALLVLGIDRIPTKGENKEIAALIEQALLWDAAPPCPGFAIADPTRSQAPMVIATGPDWSVELVLPFYAARLRALAVGGEDPNLCSAVLRVRRGTTCMLIGGDAPLGSWERLEASYIKAVAIRLPHHAGFLEAGERWSTYSDLYNAVDATHAFVSVGSNNAYGHPLREHLEAAQVRSNCRIRCTQLTTRCHPNPQRLRDETLRISAAVAWPYRHKTKPGDPRRPSPTSEAPCAASMSLWIDASGTVEVHPPKGGDHDALIGKVGHPRCER
jgi:beta-lactamase superfamily II metal-dependent hydrolase